MDELFLRQAAILRRFVDNYREGALDLNALIQRIEGIGDVLGVDAWKEAVFPIVLSMEQVNATTLHMKNGLTSADKASVDKSLLELEALLKRFETQ